MKGGKMRAYVCVYRHPIPNPSHWHRRLLAAASNDILRRFLDVYKGSYYDEGDDPSFFAADTVLKNVRKATWGVCRPELRKMLKPGDYVVFFCAKQVSELVWEYFYIGVGTITGTIDRKNIWLDSQYEHYRSFLNLLARYSNGQLEHYEPIYPPHKNWPELWKTTPYLEFDHEKSQFNLDNPLHVASYTETFEVWHSSPDQQQIDDLKNLLFPSSARRHHLRVKPRSPHKEINLLEQLGQNIDPDTDLSALRLRLMELAAGPL